MKLYTASASPFGRTVKVVAHELSLMEAITVEAVTVAPTKPNEAFQAKNPLRKIPAMELEDGTVLSDSGLIAQYLASRAGDTDLFAENSPGRWAMLADYQLAKGMADCAVSARYETFLRPEERRWPDWAADQHDKIDAGLKRFDAAPPAVEGHLTIAAIALGATLGYLDFRFTDRDWRSGHPALAEWALPILERPSFEATKPA
ncbi:MAG: glutathione S-transferase family protein [Pseudomonadota bacterium]